MKRTTYILIGLLGAGLLVLIGGMVILSFFGDKTTRNAISLDGEQIEMKLNGIHAVKVLASVNQDTELRRMIVDGEMAIVNSPEAGNEFISFPKSKYVNVMQRNDTLFVELNMESNKFSEEELHGRYFFIEGFNFKLSVDSTLNSISTNLKNAKLNLKDMHSDSLSIYAGGQHVSLDSCRFRSLAIEGSGCGIYAKGSKIENFYLNMDGVNNWTFENSEIGTEFLTGSGSHWNDLQKGECRRVVWMPKTKDAELKVTLREKSVIDVTP